MDATIRFYTELLEMRLTDRTKIEATGGEVATLVSEDGGSEIELNYYSEGSRFASPYVAGEALDHLAFKVANLDEALAEFTRAGHPVVQEVRTERSRWAYVEDPNGIYIEIFA